MQESNNNTQAAPASSLGLSIAIIVAAVIIGGAVVYTNKNNPNPAARNDVVARPSVEEKKADAKNISPVTEGDHIRGSINAPIKIVEYSDMECPFCIRLHATLAQIVKEYPNDVAWVYRHMPLSSHPKAMTEAIATECVAELGGEDKFWLYLDKIYANAVGNNRMDLSLLPKYAAEFGIDTTKFNTCLIEAKYAEKINKTVKEGFDAGAEGTPFTVIITSTGEHLPIAGAQPIEVWRQVIDEIKARQ
jgi:protein-disulfide isomerase